MRIRWTVEDVNKLAPDVGSAAAGRKLANPRQWQLLGASATHLWGELQGSGAKPYQTCIERAEPAFHCSCPSRKFPCKHGLALAYIEAEHPAALSGQEAPEWVAEWMRKRAGREERKQAKAEAASQPVDAETVARRAKDQERRATARLEKARGGIAFVAQWLEDSLRQGLASQADQPYRYWDELAARTVDAQIPGLARHFRYFPTLRHSRSDWQTPFLDTFARLHLLCCAFGQYETLAPEWRGDLDAALGMPQPKEELLALTGVRDDWCILGATGGEDEGLRYQRTWLYGMASGRTALLLDFAVRGQILPTYPAPGCFFGGEMVFYPSAWPQRAIQKESAEPRSGNELVGGADSVSAAQELYVAAAEKLPWIERVAVSLRAVTPVLRDGGWCVVDKAGDALPLSPDCDNAWELLAIGGGRPLDLFGEFDGETLLPLTVATDAGVRPLPQGGNRSDSRFTHPDYPAWRQVSTTALLGGERQQQGLSASGPAGEVLDRLYPQGTLPAGAAARSRALLAAVSVLSLYRRGVQPPRQIAPLPEPCAPDELVAAGAVAASHLGRILTEQDVPLLREWLACAAACGKRCPELLLPRLLDSVTQAKERDPHLVAVLGRRGAWLAQQRVEWSALLPQEINDPRADVLRLWEEGSAEERRSALAHLRTCDPQEARERLAVVFAGEPAAMRAAFLAQLETGLGAADQAFLEACLADKSQEVRQQAARLLCLLPESGLSRSVRQRVALWLSFKPRTGLLSRLGGRKGEIELELPEAWDPAWSREGLVEKAPRGKGAKAWWLEQTLALIPPRTWTDAWQLSPAECLALSEGHEWRESLRAGWLQATLSHRDGKWALAFIDAMSAALEAGQKTQLWQVLEPQARERNLGERLQQAKGRELLDLFSLLSALDQPWSVDFSRQLLDGWRRLVGTFEPSSDYRVYPVLREGAIRLAPCELARFEALFARELADEGPWHKILNEVRERLCFRHALHAALEDQLHSSGGS